MIRYTGDPSRPVPRADGRLRLLHVEGETEERKSLARNGIETVLRAARLGRMTWVSRTLLFAEPVGPFVETKATDPDACHAPLPDPNAFVVQCLDRPLANHAVERAIVRFLRAMALPATTSGETTVARGPTPWRSTTVHHAGRMSSTHTAMLPSTLVPKHMEPDPFVEALMPDMVVVSGIRTQIFLSPASWIGGPKDQPDPMTTLRDLSVVPDIAAAMRRAVLRERRVAWNTIARDPKRRASLRATRRNGRKDMES